MQSETGKKVEQLKKDTSEALGAAKEKASEVASDIKEKVVLAKDQASDKLNEQFYAAKQEGRSAAKDIKDSTKVDRVEEPGLLEAAKQKATEIATDLKDKAVYVKDQASDKLNEKYYAAKQEVRSAGADIKEKVKEAQK